MSGFWWLVLGLLAGWLIELAIDYRYWRRRAQLEAQRLAAREADLEARARSLDERQAAHHQREEELTALQTALAAKDAELLAQAQRTDERAEEVTRLEQAMDKRRADLDRMGLTLNEREKDMGSRNDVLKSGEADYAGRLETLQASEADVTRRVAVVSNRESAMQNWEARILAREHEVGDKEADLVRQAATAADLRDRVGALTQLIGRTYRTAEGADDLRAIEGVDDATAQLLAKADIRSFERLSETSLGELTRVLQAGGSRFGLTDPLSWAEQAEYLVGGDYLGFERLKESLRGGVRRDAETLERHEEAQARRQEAGESLAGESLAGESVTEGPRVEEPLVGGDLESGGAQPGVYMSSEAAAGAPAQGQDSDAFDASAEAGVRAPDREPVVAAAAPSGRLFATPNPTRSDKGRRKHRR